MIRLVTSTCDSRRSAEADEPAGQRWNTVAPEGLIKDIRSFAKMLRPRDAKDGQMVYYFAKAVVADMGRIGSKYPQDRFNWSAIENLLTSPWLLRNQGLHDCGNCIATFLL